MVRIDGTTLTTRVVATVRDLVQRREVPAVPCVEESTPDGPGTTSVLPTGTLRVVATASELAVATRVALVPEAVAATLAAAAAAPVTVHIDQWSATSRLVTIAPHDADVVLAVRENTNPGWVARIGGRTLAPVILDGWQQGWVVPAGLSGQVVIDFAPEAPYRAGIIGGAALLVFVALLAVLPSRRRAVSAPVASRMGVVLPLAVGGVALIITGGLLGAAIVVVAVAVVALRWAGAYDAARGAQPPAAGAQHSATGAQLAAAGAQSSAAGAPPGLRRWVRRAQLWLPPALLLCGGATWLAVEGPNRHWLPQVAGLLAVAALWLPTVVGGARRP
jgi:arabinofuranan 3-O-arabinosyltransferase